MRKPPLSFSSLVVMFCEMPDAFIGMKIKELLRWQLEKGQVCAFNLVWYLKKMWKDWQVEEQALRKSADRTPRSTTPTPMSDVVQAAMEAMG